ncbi:unnamed protein product, partial [Pocillopora meandrina]
MLQVLLLFFIPPWLLLDLPFKVQHIYSELYTFSKCKAYTSLTGKSLFSVICFYVFCQLLLSGFFAFNVRKILEHFSEAKRTAFFAVHISVVLALPDLNALANIRQEVTQFSFGSNRVR